MRRRRVLGDGARQTSVASAASGWCWNCASIATAGAGSRARLKAHNAGSEDLDACVRRIARGEPTSWSISSCPASKRRRENASAPRSAILYERLYDEDVAMMVERQRQLDARIEPERPDATMCLGALERSGRFRCASELRRTRLLRHARERRTDRARGALPASTGSAQRRGRRDVACPWHGYRFDAKTGDCLSGQACRLPPAPKVSVRDRQVWLER